MTKVIALVSRSEIDVAKHRMYVEVGWRWRSREDEKILVPVFLRKTAFRAFGPKRLDRRNPPANNMWRRDHLDQWQSLAAMLTPHSEVNRCIVHPAPASPPALFPATAAELMNEGVCYAEDRRSLERGHIASAGF
jgi:hypothetical protein